MKCIHCEKNMDLIGIQVNPFVLFWMCVCGLRVRASQYLTCTWLPDGSEDAEYMDL